MLSLIMVILHRQTPILASEFSTFCKVTIYINLSIIQRESLGLRIPFLTLSYQTRLAFLFLLVLSVSQPTMITALSMQI